MKWWKENDGKGGSKMRLVVYYSYMQFMVFLKHLNPITVLKTPSRSNTSELTARHREQ